MKIKALSEVAVLFNETKAKGLIDLDELKAFVRVDDDSFDDVLLELLKAGIKEFEARTNTILNLDEYEVEFYNERVILAPFNSLQKGNFKATFRTDGYVLFCEGSGKISLMLGFETLPSDIKLWLKNYVLASFDGSVLPSVSESLIKRYKVSFF